MLPRIGEKPELRDGGDDAFVPDEVDTGILVRDRGVLPTIEDVPIDVSPIADAPRTDFVLLNIDGIIPSYCGSGVIRFIFPCPVVLLAPVTSPSILA